MKTDQLSIRLYKTVGNATFLAMFMQRKDIYRGVLSVFKITSGGCQFVMEISVEYWNDTASDDVLTKACLL